MTVIGLLVLALGCSYPPEDFATDMATQTCDLYESCGYLETFGFTSVDDCAATVSGNYGPIQVDCPAYDKAKAQECVDGVAAMTCDDLYAGSWPQACAERCGYVGDGQLGTDPTTDPTTTTGTSGG